MWQAAPTLASTRTTNVYNPTSLVGQYEVGPFRQDGRGYARPDAYKWDGTRGVFIDARTGRRVSDSEVAANQPTKTPLWQTPAYQGDEYLRPEGGVAGYDAETRRIAARGLFGQGGMLSGLYGGGAYGGGAYGGGFQATGPAGMIAHGQWGYGQPMQYQGEINPNQQVYSPPQQQGASRFGPAAWGAMQQNTVNAARDNRASQNQYYGQASQAQNQGVLGGLNLNAQQQRNAYGRANTMMQQANNWGLF